MKEMGLGVVRLNLATSRPPPLLSFKKCHQSASPTHTHTLAILESHFVL
jgi:hypothetical protein